MSIRVVPARSCIIGPLNLQPVHIISTATVRHPRRLPDRTDKTRKLNMTKNKLWIFMGMSMTVLIGVFMLSWMIGPDRAPVQQSQGLDQPMMQQSQGLDRPRVQQSQGIDQPETQSITAAGSQAYIKRDRTATAELVEIPAYFVSRGSSLLPAGKARDSLVDIERRLTSSTNAKRKAASGVSVRPQSDTGLTANPQDTVMTALHSTASSTPGQLDKAVPETTASFAPAPAPAPATVNTDDEGSPLPGPSHTTTSIAKAEQYQETVIEQLPVVTAVNEGPWVINLVSTPSKADADRITEKALSRNIQTEQQEVTVKGKQYWRVQITGFKTAEDARNHSETAKEILGLQSIWIFKR